MPGDYSKSPAVAATSEEVSSQVILDSVPALIQFADPNGSYQYFNPAWLNYVGLPLEELRDSGWISLIHPDDRDEVIDDWHSAVSSGRPVLHESRVRRFDGEYRWFLHRIVPLRDEEGKVIKWCGASVDIDDRKRAEEQIRRDSQELRQIIDLIPQQIFVLAPDGTGVYWNRVALEYTGLTIEESLSKDVLRKVIHPDEVEQVIRERAEKISEGIPFEMEARLRAKDGTYRWFLIRLNPLRDDHGQIIHWYGTRTDIDEIKHAGDAVRNENIALREEIDKASMYEEVVGTSPAIRAVLRRVSKVAPTSSTVLILGETGTGKELIARAIHKRSQRRDRPFVSVNCAAIPQALIASELFGHEKGSFTGAVQRRIGRFELADRGTIFLDEVGDLPGETQVALLRVLQEQEIERVGSTQPIRIDVRVIAATNRDLEAAIEAGDFRSDLFYRLNVFPIDMPALRERKSDIPLLVEYFIERFARHEGRKVRPPKRETLDLLESYSWPGNVRELQNVIQRSLIVCESETFTVDESWLVSKRHPKNNDGPSLENVLTDREKQLIEEALMNCHGRVAGPRGAATKLGIPVSTLESKIKSLKIDKYRFKSLA